MSTFEESERIVSPTESDFYTWTFPGAPVSIHLHLNAVERLGREVRRAYESIPSRHVEIGGLLLGTADFLASPVIEVKDFEPFLCEYRPDHKFILSESDRRKLDKALVARRSRRDDGLTVVGYYRSHIGEGLSLSENDLTVAQAHFFDPASVFLVIKPAADGSATAGFFFWDSGRIDSEFTFLEFPFDSRLLTGARVKPSMAAAAEDLEPHHELPEPGGQSDSPAILSAASPPQAPRPASLRWLRYPLFTLLMVALGAVGYQAYLRWSAGAAAQHAAAMPESVLALQVERRGNDLRVSWNRTSPVVARAAEAVLEIRDGELQQQELRLDLDQLRNGSVLYTPSNNGVQFRLEVTAQDGTKTSETVLALTAAPPGITGTPSLPPVPSPPVTRPTVSAANEPKAPSRDSGANAGTVPPGRPPQQTSRPPADAASAPGGEASQPAPATYSPPQPLRQVQPALPPDVTALVTSEIEVEVRVHINKEGRVVMAETLPTARPVNTFLTSAARNAALLWRFEPAKVGSQAVASEVVLKFQYRPAARPE